MSAVQRVLDALAARDCRVSRNGAGWQAQCPAHDDRKPSLVIGEGDDGRALVHCQANCATGDVLAALGLADADLFERRNGHREIVATYGYTDEAGELLFEVVRFAPKDFRQRRPDGNGGWIWKLDGTRRVLYRLPQLLAAVEAGDRVYVVEGEKDVAAIEKAGAAATCNPGGAGKWRDTYSKSLLGAHVVVVADRDKPGLVHARRVAASCRTAGIEVVGVVQAASGKDAADHLAAGRGLDELVPLFSEEPESADKPSSLVTRASDVRTRSIRWAWDGRLALGYLTVQTGIEGLGKSTFGAWAIARLTRGELPGEWHGKPTSVLVLAGEDGIADTWGPRLDLAGADLDLVSFLNIESLGDDWDLRDGIDQLHVHDP